MEPNQNPDTLLWISYDEPTAGLDSVFRQDFLRVLQDFVADYKTTVLLSTHIEEDLGGIADYIIEVDNGRYYMK